MSHDTCRKITKNPVFKGFFEIFFRKNNFFQKKKVFRDIVKIHFVLIFHEDISKTAPCGRADRHTHTHRKLPTPIRRRKAKKERQRRKAKKKGKGRGEEILILLPRASPWISFHLICHMSEN